MEEKTKKPATPRKPRSTAAVPKTAVRKAAPGTTRAKAAINGKLTLMISHEEIAALAHRYWTERGEQHGSDRDDWFRAEQELLGKAS
jgi:hypothetical protein